MSRRVLAIVVLIAGLLLLALVVVFLLIQQSNQIADVPTATPLPPAEGDDGVVAAETPTPFPGAPDLGADETQLVEVVVSLQTVPRGWQMTEAELTTEMRLASDVGTNVVTRLEDAIGLYARTDIFQGETLTLDALVRDPTLIGEGTFGPASLIPFGFVGQAVPMDRLSSVAYALETGDSIDIMLSFIFLAVDGELETFLPNAATFLIIEEDSEGNTSLREIVLDPYGRFERLPTGALAHIAPRETPRPIPVSFVIQNARVIQVGPWSPPEPPQPPTPTPDPEGPTPTAAAPTPTPALPDVILVALPPQQQLLLKYALERDADIDFALRRAGDNQLIGVENVTTDFLLNRFNIEIPPQFDFTAVGKRLIVLLNEGQQVLEEETAPGGGGQ